jgi:hypothetical protein
VGGEVLVTEPEPGLAGMRIGRTDRSESVQSAQRGPTLASQTPASLGIDGLGERVDDRVKIGTDVQPVHHRVVAGVDDGGDGRRVNNPAEPSQISGRAHAAGQHGDH